jgi:hypothetical protein
MKMIFLLLLAGSCTRSQAQELYVFTEPASNMPAHSLSVKLSSKFVEGLHTKRTEGRYTPEVMFGINKHLMVHVAGSFSDMYSSGVRWESVRLYTKYRFLSLDELHSHFRMAAFGEISHSRNPWLYDELSLEGDQPGVQAGIIATQLLHKLAVSATTSYLTVYRNGASRYFLKDAYSLHALNYSLSAGYLLFPRSYKSYKQTNLNIYCELLGQKSTGKNLHYVDLAPAIQFIIASTSKLNIGYRFQLEGNAHRMDKQSWLLSFEYTFLDALRRGKRQ